jgi:hypothetical protein
MAVRLKCLFGDNKLPEVDYDENLHYYIKFQTAIELLKAG